MSTPKPDGPATYQIKVSGHLDQSWAAWFDGMTIIYDFGNDDELTTTLTGRVTDQSALRGILSKVWDLNLILICVMRVGG